ncbi:phage antirepressor KilAC domain-containing protein [Spartinivicinus ruber]|uniref:phage antirepressor KilAC domain-containing protein n=1 Tax=Spartinivicinus ruber TaxID=2683272 RepID=UPI0013D42DF7|nr:phage antirepressor KilAC domain-containing protein [Spartinivicinus ruber]
MNNINSSFLTTTAPIIIENVNIRQDEQGRFCLNDLHKAAGGAVKHRPRDWLRNKQIQELVEEYSNKQICSYQQNQALSVKGGSFENGGGTYVIRPLVYTYAAWISPSFHRKVYDSFDALVTGQIKPLDDDMAITQGLLAAQRKIEKQEALLLESQKQIEEMQPKADFVSNYVEAKGTSNLEETAKILKIKPRTFTRQLREDRVLFYNVKGNNVPYQTYLDRGYFTLRTELNKQNEMVYQSTRVTAKGHEWLGRKYKHLAIPF